MTRRRLTAAAAAVCALALVSGGVLFSRRAAASQGGIAVAGTTRADVVAIGAPKLAIPTIDVSVGVTRSKRDDLSAPTPDAMLRAQMAAGSAKARAAASAATSRRPVPAGMLATVLVRPGDRVKKGQVLATFDDTLLRLAVLNAEAAERKAGKTPDVLEAQADELRDTRADVRSQGRAKLASAQERIDEGRAQAENGLAAARKLKPQLPAMSAARPLLAAQLAAQLKKPQKTAADRATIAELQQKIGGIDQAKGLVAQIPAMEAGLRKLDEAQAQLDAGREKLSDAVGKIDDGIHQLSDGGDLMRVFAQGQSTAVKSVRSALAQATITAPCDGYVVTAMHAGEVPMIGAPVVTIRPAGETLVDTYLTPEQLRGLKVGDDASVSLDSVRGPLRGRVLDISGEQQFAPSGYPTQVVHLSSVVRMTVAIPDELPGGVPADVVIRP